MGNDAVTEEWDVVVNTGLSAHLHLLQLPSQVAAAKLADPERPCFARLKPRNGILEIDLPIDKDSDVFDRERSEVLAKNALPDDAAHAAQGDLLAEQVFAPYSKIYLTPISSCIPMHPEFVYLDAADAKTKSATKKSFSAADEAEKIKHIQVQFKKRETEEQMAARLNSFAYLQRKIDDEAWTKMKVYPVGSSESNYLANKLVDMSPSTQAIEIDANAKGYLMRLAQQSRPAPNK